MKREPTPVLWGLRNVQIFCAELTQQPVEHLSVVQFGSRSWKGRAQPNGGSLPLSGSRGRGDSQEWTEDSSLAQEGANTGLLFE